MSDFKPAELNSETAVDTRPVWKTPTVTVGEVNSVTQTAGFPNFDAPTSFGS